MYRPTCESLYSDVNWRLPSPEATLGDFCGFLLEFREDFGNSSLTLPTALLTGPHSFTHLNYGINTE